MSFKFIIKLFFEIFFTLPPSLPNKFTLYIFFLFALLITLIIFFELPEVDNVISMSFFFTNPSNCLEKIVLNSKSFECAVIVLPSEPKVIDGIGPLILFFFNLTMSSAVKCCASANEPPLPHIILIYLKLFLKTFENPLSIFYHYLNMKDIRSEI